MNIDGKVTHWVRRLYLNNENNKSITIFTGDKNSESFKITSINDIFKYKELLREAIDMRLK